MKKIIFGFLFAGITLAIAGNTAVNFKNNGSQVGGVIDNEVIYIYKNKDAGNESDTSNLKILANIAKNQICSGKDTRLIIEDAGMSVKFIYMSSQGNATIVKIDNCKGVSVTK